METAPVNIDPLVRPLLLEESDEQADRLFTHLLKEYVERVVKGVIRFKLHLNPGADTRAEAEDIYQEVILHLVTQLQRFRKSPKEHPITDLRGIAAVIAHRTCAQWLRLLGVRDHRIESLTDDDDSVAWWPNTDYCVTAR
jgi:DNA-directed RNA polymerase specialized sigma subunit, sigma24 homolog